MLCQIEFRIPGQPTGYLELESQAHRDKLTAVGIFHCELFLLVTEYNCQLNALGS